MRRGRKGPSAGASRLAATGGRDLDTGALFDALVADTLFVEDGEVKARFPTQGSKGPLKLKALSTVFDGTAATAFAEAFAVFAKALGAQESRSSNLRLLKSGFVAFLTGRKTPPISLADIDTRLLAEFDNWLIGRHPRHVDSRTAKMTVVRALIERMRLMPRWNGMVRDDIAFPSKRRRSRDSSARTRNKVLAQPDYDALWVAASRKSKRVVALHDRRQALIEASRASSPTPVTSHSDPVALAAWMSDAYPDSFPPIHYLLDDAALKRVPEQTWNTARRMLMPDVDELLPALLILATVFALNPGVIRTFRYRTDYRMGPSIGRRRLFIAPTKLRGKRKRQRNSVVATEDLDNPARVIRYLEERTAFIRARVGAPHARMLFVFRMLGKATSFEETRYPLDVALKKFGRRNKIDELRLDRLRSSTLDRVHEITGGDLLKVRAVANHQSVQTTFGDYDTDGMARRGEESLSAAMLQNDRFIQTNGAIRPFLVDPALDKGSATPGYACLDPLRSAIPGEEDGVLCKAYGRCPICPLAAIQPTPRAYAYLDALAQRIDEAPTEALVTGPEWIGRWSIVKKSLVRQMRLFPRETIEAAEHVSISPLPPLE